MSRRVARLELFKIVFEAEMNNILPETILEDFIERDDIILSKKDIEFLTMYVEGISLHNEELNSLLQTTIEGWSLERIGNVEKALLKCSAYELRYQDIGYEIVVNEVVEIAKIYGDEKTPEFINGVLAKLIKEKS